MKTKIENQIKTIKYCHTPRTRQEMDSFCEKNGITARTLRNYSKNGMDFNDVHYDMFMRYKVKDIITELDLQKPIYRNTTNFGHFGREGFSWERIKSV